MPAAIDQERFASFRVPAWHGLGNVFDREITDYREMLTEANMADLNVRFEEIALPSHPGANFVVPALAVVRDNNITGNVDVLGIVGSRYKIIPLEDAFSFLQSLQDGARWETAGLIKGGRVAFGSIALDREIVLDPNGVSDVTKCYLLVHTSFDGTSAVSGGRTGVRVVCQNTLDMAISGGLDQQFSIRHTNSADERMKAVAEMWRATNLHFDAFEAEAAQLYATSVTDDQFRTLVTDIFPKPELDKKGAFTKWEKRVDSNMLMWNRPENAGIRNTAWGALNALTEASQWGRNVQNTDNGLENAYAAGAGLDNVSRSFRQMAFNRVSALV